MKNTARRLLQWDNPAGHHPVAQRITAAQAEDIRSRLESFELWFRSLGRNWYHMEEIPSDLQRVSNEELSALEIYDFIRTPPDRYFLYISKRHSNNDAFPASLKEQYVTARIEGRRPPSGLTYVLRATTWTGNILGRVVAGDEWRSNFGDWRRPVVVNAINNEWYHGIWYVSAGNYARVKRSKPVRG